MVSWEIRQGDCIERMAEMEEASIDAVVCDPPYGIGFMGPAAGFSTGAVDPATSTESSKTSSSDASGSNACPDCGGVIGGALRNSHPT